MFLNTHLDYKYSSLLLSGLLGAMLVFGSCGTPPADPSPEIYDLSNIPLSDELRPAIEAGRLVLTAPEPTGKPADDWAIYRNLAPRLYRPETMHEAGAELFALWRQEPLSFLWIELAMRRRHVLKNDFDYETMLNDPVFSDRSQGAGAYLQGNIEYKNGTHIPHFEAVQTHRSVLTPTDQSLITLTMAYTKHVQGNSIGAVQMLLDDLPRIRVAEGSLIEAKYWQRIGEFLNHEDRLDDALHAVVLSEAMWTKVARTFDSLDTRRELASILQVRQEFVGAAIILDRAIKDAKDQNHPWILTKILSDASTVCSNTGEWERGLQFSLEALALTKAAKDSLNSPRLMVNATQDLLRLNRVTECRAYLDSAKAWVYAYKDPRNLRGFPMQEVPYYLHLGDYATARLRIEEAEGLVSEGALAIDEAEFHLQQIKFALELGEPDLAYRALNRLQSLKEVLYDKLPDSNRLAEFELASAKLLARQGEYRAAVGALDKAGSAVRNRGGDGLAWDFHRSKGELALMRGDADSAGYYFTKCLEIAEEDDLRQNIADSRFLLGLYYLESGKPAAAQEVFKAGQSDESFGARFRTRLASQVYLATSYARNGEPEKALAEFRLALAACNEHTPPDLLARLHLENGRALTMVRREKDAESSFWESRHILTNPGRGKFSPELRLANRRIWDELTELMIGLYVDNPKLAHDKSVPIQTLAIINFPSNGDEGARNGRDVRLSLDDFQATQPWLIFHVGAERSFRWLIHGQGVELDELPGQSELLPVVAAVVADIKRPHRPVDDQAVLQLSSLLLCGVEEFWTSGQILNLTPDGILNVVPWPLLVVADKDNPGNTRQALEIGAICEKPTLDFTRSETPTIRPEKNAPGGALLVYGNNKPLDPKSTGPNPSLLSHAEDEARSIASMWPKTQVDLRLGSTGDPIEPEDLEGYEVIHLAAHTQTSQGPSRRSTMRVATSASNLPLTANGLSKLSLKSELIFLSCCEAARPLSSDGGGLNNLARACLTAGAKTVIASGQLIDDESSGELARLFYQHWLAGESKAEALRKAQLELRESRSDWAHPFYWATYRLLGAGE